MGLKYHNSNNIIFCDFTYDVKKLQDSTKNF